MCESATSAEVTATLALGPKRLAEISDAVERATSSNGTRARACQQPLNIDPIDKIYTKQPSREKVLLMRSVVGGLIIAVVGGLIIAVVGGLIIAPLWQHPHSLSRSRSRRTCYATCNVGCDNNLLRACSVAQ